MAAFHCQAFVFLECEKTNQKGTYALMEERFYGDPEKRIKGVCDQLIDGDNAFAFLYNKHEGVNGVERTLKEMCCGNSTSTNYVAGVHFTAKMIGTKSHKKLSGGSLWRAGLDVARSIKKAMAILPKLDVKVVNLGKNLQVLGYASGKNFENFIQYIDNGMYSLSLKEGKGAANLLESDDDNEVVGHVVHDDGVIGKLDNDDVQEVTEQHLDSWNPFDSDDAPEGYLFFGKLSFLCLGPASDFFSETLSSKGRQVTSVEDKKSMGRAAMLKEVTDCTVVNHDVGGSDFDEIHHIVERCTKIKLIAVLLDIANVGRANAVLQPQQGMALKDGFALEYIDSGHAGAAPVQGGNQGIGLNQLGTRSVDQQGGGLHARQIFE